MVPMVAGGLTRPILQRMHEHASSARTPRILFAGLTLLLSAVPAQAELRDLVLSSITQAEEVRPPRTKSPAPAFTERTVRFADLAGKTPVIVLYWSPAVPASVAEVRRLQAMAAETPKVRFFTAVRAIDDHEIDAVKQVLQEQDIRMETLLDKQLSLGSLIQTPYLPAYTGLSADGTERLRGFSALDDAVVGGGTLASRLRGAADLPPVAPVEPKRLGRGDTAPDFALPNLEGRTVSLQKQLGKRRTMVVFWSVYCPHCQKEIPRLQRYLNSRSKPLNIISVTRFSNMEDRLVTQNFLRENKVDFPVLVDSGQTIRRYAVPGVPYWLILDEKGHVLAEHAGVMAGLEGFLRRFE